MDAVEVFKALEAECKGCRTLTISGGNPALHDLSGLINLLRGNRWFVNIETQGSRVQKWFAQADLVTFSPKPPSSDWRTDVASLDECVRWARRAVIKVVVFDDTDYAYAQMIHNNFPGTPFYLQVGNSDVGEEVVTLRDKLLDKYHELVQKVIDDPEMQDVFVLPQIHTILWGNKPLV
jgi:7-carboxy-7-deazaguanine synthase